MRDILDKLGAANRSPRWGFALALVVLAALGSRPASAAEYVDQVIRYHNPNAGDATLVWGIGDAWKRVPRAQWPAGTSVFQRHMNTPMRRVSPGWFEVTLRVPQGARIGASVYVNHRSDGGRICETYDVRLGSKDQSTFGGSANGSPITFQGNPDVIARAEPATSLRRAAAYLAGGLLGVALFAWGIRYVPFERNRRLAPIALALVMLLGLSLRLAWVTHENARLGNDPKRLVSDESGYHGMAKQLLRGQYFVWPGRMPLYPSFLAGCYLVFGDENAFSQVTLVQAFLTASVVLLTYVLARNYVGVRGALLAALLMAVLPSQMRPISRLLSEAMFGPLLLAAIVLLVWAFRRPGAARFAAAGAVLGVASLCRPNGAYLFVILALVPFVCRDWPWRRRVLLPAAYVLGLALVLAPWTWHNWRTFGRFMPLTVPGSTVWQGSPEYYRLIRDDGRTLANVFANELNSKKPGGYNIFSLQGSDYFTRRGLDSIRAEPRLYLSYSWRKALYFWVGSPHADWPRLRMFDPYAWTSTSSAGLIAGIFASRLFPIVGLLAILWLAWRRQLRPLWLPLAILGYFTLFHGLLYAEVRYSDPLQPVVAVFIAVASAAWLDARHRTAQRATEQAAENRPTAPGAIDPVPAMA